MWGHSLREVLHVLPRHRQRGCLITFTEEYSALPPTAESPPPNDALDMEAVPLHTEATTMSQDAVAQDADAKLEQAELMV